MLITLRRRPNAAAGRHDGSVPAALKAYTTAVSVRRAVAAAAIGEGGSCRGVASK